MFAHKAKRFPGIPSDSLLFPLSQTCAFILAANWVMQGVRGMDRGELSFRLLLLAALIATFCATQPALNAEGILAAMAAAHSINFILNGHPWVCLRYCRFYRRSPAAIDLWLSNWIYRIQRMAWLEECVMFGSRARGKSDLRSDIDLRLITPKSYLNWLRVNALLLLMRTDAAFRAIPLDLYAYDTPRSLLRFDQTEPLLIISDRAQRLRHLFAYRDLEAV